MIGRVKPFFKCRSIIGCVKTVMNGGVGFIYLNGKCQQSEYVKVKPINTKYSKEWCINNKFLVYVPRRDKDY